MEKGNHHRPWRPNAFGQNQKIVEPLRPSSPTRCRTAPGVAAVTVLPVQVAVHLLGNQAQQAAQALSTIRQFRQQHFVQFVAFQQGGGSSAIFVHRDFP
jgi:hypothetical protein